MSDINEKISAFYDGELSAIEVDDLLNIIQIKLLKQVRSNKGPINKDLERSIFMSINAIAAAMQTTG